jgi:hypothetical protein
MRKFILITAMVLASATAQAGQSRNLTVADNEQTATVTPPALPEVAKPAEVKSAEVKPAETPAPAEAAKPADAPKYVERPAAVDATAKPAPAKTADATKTDKPKHRHESTEARVIYELHRHGIYW